MYCFQAKAQADQEDHVQADLPNEDFTDGLDVIMTVDAVQSDTWSLITEGIVTPLLSVLD